MENLNCHGNSGWPPCRRNTTGLVILYWLWDKANQAHMIGPLDHEVIGPNRLVVILGDEVRLFHISIGYRSAYLLRIRCRKGSRSRPTHLDF